MTGDWAALLAFGYAFVVAIVVAFLYFDRLDLDRED
jgi:hypothetical protein